MNGKAIRIPEGGAVREILPSRLANAATRYAGRCLQNEPRCEKTGLRGFRPGPTQTRLYSHRRWLEA